MRLSSLFAGLTALTAVSGLTISLDPFHIFGVDLTASNYFGAPLAPWQAGHFPGWYYGPNPQEHPDLFCLIPYICRLLDYLPLGFHCPHYPPPPPDNDGYHQTFHNLTGATQADDYMTYGLVETIADCKNMCNSVNGCQFANSYHDVNGKDGSPLLTCALFRACHTADDADNRGGQTQPDGSVDFITDSDGWCKN
ncbi:hypothetical protein AMATHDRAFT_48822 [Amanita thiersii Skay4041]|uniref:Apple domain-containing protein n=1 Tax=Amanita thiersii Skay4041 TaxID=703135 RepID=A0A2A9NFC3_9AGAR|nr:hypothetical protein AMATHDRAFT_48822 [Amanita thiersii Skay4041]